MLSVAPFWGKFLDVVDERPLTLEEVGGVSMTRGPDETPSPFPPGFRIRLKEPNVELLLKANLNDEMMKRLAPQTF